MKFVHSIRNCWYTDDNSTRLLDPESRKMAAANYDDDDGSDPLAVIGALKQSQLSSDSSMEESGSEVSSSP
jgi:hypothetical protein